MAIHIPLKHLNQIEETLPISPPQSPSNISTQTSKTFNPNYSFTSQITTVQKSLNKSSSHSFYSLSESFQSRYLSTSSNNNNIFRFTNSKANFIPLNNRTSTQLKSPPKSNSESIDLLLSTKTLHTNHINTIPLNQDLLSSITPSPPVNCIPSTNLRYDPNNFQSHNKIDSVLSQDTVFRQPDTLLLQSNKYNNNNSKELEMNINYLQAPIKLNVKLFEKLLDKKNSLFYVLLFLDSKDLKQFYDVSKRFRLLFNTLMRNVYYNAIIPKLKRNNYYLQLLRSKIRYSLIRNQSMKIDLVVYFRFEFNTFILNKKYPDLEQYDNFINKNITLAFIYKNSRTYQDKNNINDKPNTSSHLVDYYSFDLFHNNISRFPSIYMTREFTTFTNDILQKTYIQPILPFKLEDKGIININIFSPENLFVEPSSIKIKMKVDDIPSRTRDATSEDNPRICEYEDLCNHWKNLGLLEEKELVAKQLSNVFEPCFQIVNVHFEDVGYLIFKVILKAVLTGEINGKPELGIELVIKEKNDEIVNEIKKNDLLFERRNKFELRVGDTIIFYLTNNK